MRAAFGPTAKGLLAGCVPHAVLRPTLHVEPSKSAALETLLARVYVARMLKSHTVAVLRRRGQNAIGARATSCARMFGGAYAGTVGWHYFSNAPCLMRPRLVSMALLV